jgi:hypothetical protein
MAVIDTAREHGTASHAGLPVPAAIAGLALLAAALHLVTPFNHDHAYFIESAGRLLDGGRFGVEIADINPPHVFWISAIPVWLARQVGARSDAAATIFTAALAAASLIASHRLIAPGRFADSMPRALFPIAAIIVLFAPGYDFGQREYWMVLLTLPYIVVRSLRADDRAISGAAAALIGVAACLGFCMKPYYLLVPIALEVWLLAQTRRPFVWISPETVAMGLTGLIYFGAVTVYVPTYFGEELPNALLGYWAYESALPAVLWTAVTLTAPAVALGWLDYAILRQDKRMPTLAQAFAVVGAAFLIAALWQMKPWPYHFVPSLVFSSLAAAVLLTSGTARAGMSRIRLGALLVLLVLGCLPTAAETVRSFGSNGTTVRVEALAAVFRANRGPNGNVAGFITSPRDVYPAVVAAQVNWAVPFCCDYLIPAAVRADEAPAARRPAIEAAGRDQAERVVAAIRAKAPGVIVIDAGNNKLGFGNREFDYLQWLNARTGFADVLRGYQEIGPIGPFRLFVRR